jgi:hypothetical protein
MSEGIKTIHDKFKAADDPAFLLHDEALQELSRALWYPLVLQRVRLSERCDISECFGHAVSPRSGMLAGS